MVGLISDNIGLVVITLERYFKIVHAIAHRKYYRDWMTKVGVALPWIGGACLILIPAVSTTRIVNGQCGKMNIWPNQAMQKVRLHILQGVSIACCISDRRVVRLSLSLSVRPSFCHMLALSENDAS